MIVFEFKAKGKTTQYAAIDVPFRLRSVNTAITDPSQLWFPIESNRAPDVAKIIIGLDC